MSSVAGVAGYSGGINGTGQFSNATPQPISTFTPSPSPAVTPQVSIVMAGAPAPAPTSTVTPLQTVTSVPVHGGSYAAQIGGLYDSTYAADDLGYNGLCQTVTIPAAGGTLSAYVFSQSNQTSAYIRNMIAALDSTTLAMTAILYMENPTTSTSPGDTSYRAIGPIALPAGKYTLFVGQYTRSGTAKYSGYWWVDDMVMTSP